MAITKPEIKIAPKPTEVRSDVPTEKPKLARINLNVPEDIRLRWHDAAHDNRMPLAELIRQAVEEFIEKRKQS